jgi:hypothetical protein
MNPGCASFPRSRESSQALNLIVLFEISKEEGSVNAHATSHIHDSKTPLPLDRCKGLIPTGHSRGQQS